MKRIEKEYNKAIERWRINKGVGSMLIPTIYNDKLVLLYLLQHLYKANKDYRTYILVENFNERLNIINLLTNQENEKENNDEFKRLLDNRNIIIYTFDYANDRTIFADVMIAYHIDDNYIDSIVRHLKSNKFKLAIFNKLLKPEVSAKLYKVCPNLDVFSSFEVALNRLSSPVEEMTHGVSLVSVDINLHKNYNDFISTSMSIFNDFDTLNKARQGDTVTNTSSAQYCAHLAAENGWNPNLDMSVEVNRQLDSLYNPNALKERASTTYEIIRSRNVFLTSYKHKVDSIIAFLKEHNNEQFIIISKYSEFADKLATEINKEFGLDKCKSLHDKIDSIPAIDDNGNIITYKSGAKKGTPKMWGYASQAKLFVKRFAEKRLQILSLTNAPDKDLSLQVDGIILSSPLCMTPNQYLYRLGKVSFNSETIHFHTFYIKDSIEQKAIEGRNVNESYTLVTDYENNIITDDLSDVYFVD